MDLKYIKELIALFDKSGLGKIVVKEKNGEEILLEKSSSHPSHEPHYHPAPKKEPPPHSPQTPAAILDTPPTDDPKQCIKSPMVGTYYSASSPDAKPFVKVGDTVSADTVVCIIEAMKVMNEIKSEKSGTITKILVKDAESVEFGQNLFVIK